jgi:hypothetical protein
MTITMSFIQSSWPKPIYLEKTSYCKNKKPQKIFYIKNDNGVENIENITNSIVERSAPKYFFDQVLVCAMVWWIILGGIKKNLVSMFNQNGTRY